jgi:hypothetical protein
MLLYDAYLYAKQRGFARQRVRPLAAVVSIWQHCTPVLLLAEATGPHASTFMLLYAHKQRCLIIYIAGQYCVHVRALQERCMDKSLQLALARAELDHLNLLHNQLPYKEMLVQAKSLLGADKGKGLDLTNEQVTFSSLMTLLYLTLDTLKHCQTMRKHVTYALRLCTLLSIVCLVRINSFV